MSSNRRARAFPFRLSTLGVAVASALIAANVQAAALGNLTVLSALGQPLHAEIELVSAAPEEPGSLQAKVASFDAFRQANVEYNPVLGTLRFAIEQRGERRFIRVFSTQPINEPFVDLLLELRGADSRLVREYLFLLDPPSTSADAPVASSVASPANSTSAATTQSRAAAAAAVGAVRADPPATSPAKPLRPRTAQQAQNAAADAPAAQVRSRPAAAAASTGRSRLSLADISVSPGTGPTFAVEERAAMEKAVTEANERVKMLEQKVDAMQKLLAATNNLLAELRKHNESVKGTGQPAQGTQPDTAAAPVAAAPAVSAATAVPASASSPAASAAVSASASAPPAPAGAEVKPAAADAPAAPVAAAPAPKPAAAKPRPAPPPPPPGLLDTLLDNLFALSAGGLSLLFLCGAGAYLARRRRKQDSQRFDSTLFAETAAARTSAPAPTIGQDADNDNTVFIPGFPDPGTSMGGGDDPVAEADVYIAYGRDIQAEEILRDALEKQPERQAVRLKLLSIYASRKDRESFQHLANELHAMTGGQGEEWASAAALGAVIDPGNALYAEQQQASEGIPSSLLAQPAAVPTLEESPAPAEPAAGDPVAVPELPPVEATVAAPVIAESSPIDLDFALGIPPEVEQPALAAPDEIATQPETPEQIVAEIAAEMAAEIPPLEPASEPVPAIGTGPIEFELPDLALPEAEPEPVLAAIARANDTAGPGPIEFELPDLPLAQPESPAPELAQPTQTSPGPGPIDFDFELPEIPALAQPEEMQQDASGTAGGATDAVIDLDGMLADLLPPDKKPD